MDGGYWGATKPPPGVKLDLSDSLSRGLALCWALRERNGAAQDATGKPAQALTLSGGVWTPTPLGPGLDFVSPNFATTATADTLPDAPYLGPLTIICRAIVRKTSDYNSFCTKGASSGAGSTPFDFRTTNGNPPALVIVRSAGAYRDWVGAAITLNKWQTFGVTTPSNLIETVPTFWIDGVGTAGSAGAGVGTGAVTGTSQDIRVGRREDGAVQLDGRIAYLMIWSRALTPDEIRSVGANPFQMFAPPVWRRYFVPADGGGAPTILAVPAAVQAEAPLPTIVAQRNATIAALAAGVEAAAPLSSVAVQVQPTILALTADAAATALLPAISVQRQPNIAALAASAQADALLSLVTAQRQSTILALAASAELSAALPTAAGQMQATILALAAEASLDARAAVLLAQRQLTVLALAAELIAAANAATVLAGGTASVQAVAAGSLFDGLASTIQAQRQPVVLALPAETHLSAPIPVITAQIQPTVLALPAGSQMSAPAPLVVAGGTAVVLALPATLLAAALESTVQADRAVLVLALSAGLLASGSAALVIISGTVDHATVTLISAHASADRLGGGASVSADPIPRTATVEVS